jgi:cyclophilin family peptidyl-prolyl cis-trans isomerase
LQSGAQPAVRGTGRRPAGGVPDPAREARVRRLAMQALIDAGSADEAVIRRAIADPDVQVRLLAMRAASNPRNGSSDPAAGAIGQGLADTSPMVRLEALRALRSLDVKAGLQPGPRLRPSACEAAMAAARDPDPHVALVGLDQLAPCSSAEAVALLEQAVDESSQTGSARGWHRAAHGILALASASPGRAAAALPRLTDSRIGSLRIYAARAAAVLKDRAALETLARDSDDNVKEAAIDGLTEVAGHGADGLYIGALATGGYQVLRAAAAALAGTDGREGVPALSAALHRLVVEGRDNSRDARRAIAETLRGLGVAADAATPVPTAVAAPVLGAEDLRRLASARARVTIRGVGSFELALIAGEAPMSAFRFVRLVESGYYNGLTFHRVVPNFVIQGGSPGASEYIGDATFMRDELGQWPHVRGAVGISTRGRDTGDAQIFVDLVDNPRLDHRYTVFAHVLSGMEVVDAILEGDVIEKIDIVRG